VTRPLPAPRALFGRSLRCCRMGGGGRLPLGACDSMCHRAESQNSEAQKQGRRVIGCGQRRPRTLARRTRTNTQASATRAPDAHTHARTSALPVHRQSSRPGLHLRREALGGCVGHHRLRHVARPAGTRCHATSRESLPPQHPAHTHKATISSACARPPQKKETKNSVVIRGLTVARLSHEATIALSHEVTDAAPQRG
jgi:hypothetical protein